MICKHTCRHSRLVLVGAEGPVLRVLRGGWQDGVHVQRQLQRLAAMRHIAGDLGKQSSCVEHKDQQLQFVCRGWWWEFVGGGEEWREQGMNTAGSARQQDAGTL